MRNRVYHECAAALHERFADTPFRRYSGHNVYETAMILKPSRIRRLLLVAVLALGAVTAQAVPAEAQCVNAAQARRAIAAGKAVPLSIALQRAGISGQIVRVELCRDGRRAVYRIAVLDRKGRLRQEVIPAN